MNFKPREGSQLMNYYLINPIMILVSGTANKNIDVRNLQDNFLSK